MPNHIWFTENGDGTVRLGMTSVATAMAGNLVAFTPKKVGRSVRPGKSCATLESGKWVGPAKSAAGGEVIEVNTALEEEPSLANQDPYAAWMVVLRPGRLGQREADPDAREPRSPRPTKSKMDEDGFAGCA